MNLGVAVWAETLKARRSRLPWLTVAAMALAPLVGGLFMLVLKDPALAQRMGLLATKAQLRSAGADWPTYWGLLAQTLGLGGFVVFGIIAAWLFGREFSDRTAKDLLALPTPRAALVVAKFLVLAVWSAALTALVYVLGFVVGSLIGLPDGSATLAAHAGGEILGIAALTICLVTPFAWVASVGRGYLAAVGAIFLAIFASQVIAALGLGAYFPWSVAALASGVAGPGAQDLGITSYALAPLTGLVGIVATVRHWQTADQR